MEDNDAAALAEYPGGTIEEGEIEKHRRGYVYEVEVIAANGDEWDLDIDATCVMVLRGCGPCGYPGMPEVGNFALPAKLLEQGVRDMVQTARFIGAAAEASKAGGLARPKGVGVIGPGAASGRGRWATSPATGAGSASGRSGRRRSRAPGRLPRSPWRER